MTPYELALHVDEFNQKQKQAQQDLILQAYLTAGWGRAKKMPDFERLFEQEEEQKPQTDEDMLAEIKKLNAAFGGSVY